MNSTDGSKLGYMLLGIGLGAVAGLLIAPRSGEESRRIIRERTDEGRDFIKGKAQEFSDQAEGLAEKGKDWVNRQKNAAEQAFDDGKQAYRDTNSNPQ